jgi:hypothetical protein
MRSPSHLIFIYLWTLIFDSMTHIFYPALKIGYLAIALLCLVTCGEDNLAASPKNKPGQKLVDGEYYYTTTLASQEKSTKETLSNNSTAAKKPVRVQFAKGANSKTIKNTLIRGDRDAYLLGAKQGQQIDLKISSLENNAVFDLIAPNGKAIESEATTRSSKLLMSGYYRVIVGGTRGNASYKLNVKIK